MIFLLTMSNIRVSIEMAYSSQMQNGIDNDMHGLARDLNTLNFEEDEEETYNIIDLPKHACA